MSLRAIYPQATLESFLVGQSAAPGSLREPIICFVGPYLLPHILSFPLLSFRLSDFWSLALKLMRSEGPPFVRFALLVIHRRVRRKVGGGIIGEVAKSWNHRTPLLEHFFRYQKHLYMGIVVLKIL